MSHPEAQAQALPWRIHAAENKSITITELVIIYPILAKCGGGQVSINSVAGAILTPAAPMAIAKIKADGTATTSLEGGAIAGLMGR